MTAPLNPQQFGPYTPNADARLQSIAGGFDKLQATFPNGKPGFYPSKENRKPFELKHLLTAATALGANHFN